MRKLKSEAENLVLEVVTYLEKPHEPVIEHSSKKKRKEVPVKESEVIEVALMK